MIESLRKLAPLIEAFITRELEKQQVAAGVPPGTPVAFQTGISAGALRRAGEFFVQNISSDEADLAAPCIAFVHAWAPAENMTFRRVMAAISSPAAKGREVEVLAALMQGASIAEALASMQPAPSTDPETSNVVPLRNPRSDIIEEK